MSGGSATPGFAVGDDVTVRDLKKSGHIRTPHYIRNKHGVVVQYCGAYLNPEDLARGKTSGPAVHLYRVMFDQRALWPDEAPPEGDRLVIEIYEHWLAPRSAAPREAADGAA
ncbi:MAG: SH3-like domain-containing protein [Pseudomonadota bacterium]